MKSTFKGVIDELLNFADWSRKDNSPVLNHSSNRTQFSDVQRRINIYLRALWDCEFPIIQSNIVFENKRRLKPFIENGFISLPGIYHDLTLNNGATLSGLEIYRAASAHAAAHLIYSKHHFQVASIDKWQKALISTIEDARVEALSIRRFPGLKRLWSKQHRATPALCTTAGDYLDRLARALLDDSYHDEDAWIVQGRQLFKTAKNLEDYQISWNIGLALAQSFQIKKIRFNERRDKLTAPYRDDNRYLWNATKSKADEVAPNPFNYKSIFGIRVVTTIEVDATNAISPAPQTERCEVQEPVAEAFIYSEWDYRGQIDTQAWVTLREKKPKSGDLQIVDQIVEQNSHLWSRMKTFLHSIRYEGVRRIRKLEEGDEIDINAAVRAQIDINLGIPPDSRIMMRSLRKNRDISVLVLLDLSRSTMKKVASQEHTVLELTQQVCILFANAISSVGDPFAIHGFCSETRHRVEYYRFKDFDQPYDDVPKAKIAGMTGQKNTRMGAAVRHATYCLNAQKSSKKLLMIITDGAPSDDDIRDPKYFRIDTKKAVKDARRDGIETFCISLDPKADLYVSSIFGARNYLVVDHIKSLPEKILLLYASLTH